MPKVKPLIPPKPSLPDFRLKDSNVENASLPANNFIVANGRSDVNEKCHEQTAFSSEMITDRCALNEPENETDCSPKPKRHLPPCPAPKPKPKPKNDDTSETRNHISKSQEKLDSESVSVICSGVTDSTAVICSEVEMPQPSLSVADAAAMFEQKCSLPVKSLPPDKCRKPSTNRLSVTDFSFQAALQTEVEILSTDERGTPQETVLQYSCTDVQNDHSASKQKRQDHLVSGSEVKPEACVKTDVADSFVEDSRDKLPSSGDLGRLYRSPSYEKALTDDVLVINRRWSLSPGEEALPKRTHSVSSNLSDVSDSYPDLGTKIVTICNDMVTVNNLLDSSTSSCVHTARSPPPHPPTASSKPNASFPNSRKKDVYEGSAADSMEPTAVSICVTPSNLEKSVYPSLPQGKSSNKEPRNKPGYVNVNIENLNSSPHVKRSSSDGVNKLPAKSRQRKKVENHDHSRKEKDQRSSVFYCNLDLADGASKSIRHDSEQRELEQMHRQSDAYLIPAYGGSDSCRSEGTSPKLKEDYANMNAELLSKVSCLQSLRKPSDLGAGTEDTYSEINDLDVQTPAQLAAEHALADEEEGYSMIGEDKEPGDGVCDDTDYIYADNWTGRSQNSSISDPYVNDNSCEEVSVSTSSDVREKLSHVLKRRLCDTPRSDPVSCDADRLNPVSSSLSRSSSGISTDTACLSENSSSPQQLPDKKVRTKKPKTKAFLTAQEILTSEKTFVDVLRLLSQDFIAAMNAANTSFDRQIIAPSVLSQIIKYLPELLKFNEELFTDLNFRIQNWENDPRIADIFVKKGPFLKLYTNYIREFNSMVALLDDTRKKNPDFDCAVTNFENSFCPIDNLTLMHYSLGRNRRAGASHCAKLALKHYMLKPIQRIPQYRMLLSEYQKNLNEDSPDYKNASTAILIVHDVAEHANQSMKYGDHLNKLLEIQDSLIGQFEVVAPGRTLLKEGILMKLSRKDMQPRMFYLFSDILLYTTPVASGFKVNNAIPLSTVKVSDPMKEDFQNEFSIISTQRSFTVSARTQEEKMEWLEAMDEAISNTQARRHSYCQGKLSSPSIVNIDLDMMDFRLGTKAPVWIPDDRVSMCMICKDEFSLLFRRHHCRGCGKVICGKCSSYEAPLRYLQYKTERVCRECFESLNKVVDDMDEFDPNDFEISRRDSQGDMKFGKRRIKSQFRSFAADVGTSKSVPRPAVLQEVNASDVTAEMSGYLHLWKDRKWRKTWFVLKQKVLYTFKASEDAAAEKSTPLLGYEITPCETYFQGIEPNLIFELMHRGMPSIIFKTESPQSRDKWMVAMRNATIP